MCLCDWRINEMNEACRCCRAYTPPGNDGWPKDTLGHESLKSEGPWGPHWEEQSITLFSVMFPLSPWKRESKACAFRHLTVWLSRLLQPQSSCAISSLTSWGSSLTSNVLWEGMSGPQKGAGKGSYRRRGLFFCLMRVTHGVECLWVKTTMF